MMLHSQILKSLGCLPDKEDKRDFQLHEMIAGAVKVPRTLDLRNKQSSVKEQGPRGTCTSFAMASIAEQANGVNNLSEEYLFKRTKEHDVADYNYSGYGAYLRSVCKAITASGACFEDELPYNPDGGEDYWKKVKITEDIDDTANIFRMASYASVGSREAGIKLGLLTSQLPVLSGISLSDNYEEAKTTGYLPLPKGNTIGGHAISIVGYTTTHWIAKNSWGKDWGDDGYLYIPFAYPLFGSWSFVDVDNEYLKDDIKKEILIRKCSEYAKVAFKKALDKNIMTVDSYPHAGITKQDFAVFLDRMGLLD